MYGGNINKIVSLLAAIALMAHAFAGLYFEEIILKGGSSISWDASPINFLLIVSIEILVSIYVVWVFLIKSDDVENISK